MYGRMHWDKPSQTITGGFGSMGGKVGLCTLKRKELLHPPMKQLEYKGFQTGSILI